jgi:hypothetical protein
MIEEPISKFLSELFKTHYYVREYWKKNTPFYQKIGESILDKRRWYYYFGYKSLRERLKKCK